MKNFIMSCENSYNLSYISTTRPLEAILNSKPLQKPVSKLKMSLKLHNLKLRMIKANICLICINALSYKQCLYLTQFTFEVILQELNLRLSWYFLGEGKVRKDGENTWEEKNGKAYSKVTRSSAKNINTNNNALHVAHWED